MAFAMHKMYTNAPPPKLTKARLPNSIGSSRLVKQNSDPTQAIRRQNIIALEDFTIDLYFGNKRSQQTSDKDADLQFQHSTPVGTRTEQQDQAESTGGQRTDISGRRIDLSEQRIDSQQQHTDSHSQNRYITCCGKENLAARGTDKMATSVNTSRDTANEINTSRRHRLPTAKRPLAVEQKSELHT
ncbi:hypothetical protein SARC_06790 [Sphaeroforma arctica JP610]|uniref:Uncharacterized protein n=1 Tax=Sphaeroforma arctica JP610 TaxID=667725 RepID=A0A0L0FY24_9EUKA|nr:hypothetical protein SARC_06790 [Sphaeroforma arctica JP610]KNC80863.1 hypothetical protein SARC_06790 [Sphaeroforma arctica JP610]|eukprot:XP_014154765.1 hypothetical protein SARC_06790 [Sphaeroforma arctica JP610]